MFRRLNTRPHYVANMSESMRSKGSACDITQLLGSLGSVRGTGIFPPATAIRLQKGPP